MFSSFAPQYFLISPDLKFPFHVDDSLIFISWLNLSSDLWFIFSAVFWALLFKLSLCASTSTQNQIHFLPVMGSHLYYWQYHLSSHLDLHSTLTSASSLILLWFYQWNLLHFMFLLSMFPGSGSQDCNLSPIVIYQYYFFNFLTMFPPPLSLPFYQPAQSL